MTAQDCREGAQERRGGTNDTGTPNGTQKPVQGTSGARYRVTRFVDAWDNRLWANPDKEIAWIIRDDEELDLMAGDIHILLNGPNKATALHQPETIPPYHDADDPYCPTCQSAWPCDTAKALGAV